VLGHQFQFKIIRFNESRHNIVVSRRVLLEAEREAILDRIQVGAIVEGRVKSLVDYGAFVDVGGIDGLLHNSDISWGRVKHPSEVLSVGDPVTVKVLKFDKKKRKLSLGLRQIQEDPWLTAGDRYPLGSEVVGPVISKTDYGVFIEIEPGVEGLVHSTGPLVPDAAKEALRKAELGERIKATVLDMDLPKKRISLGLVQ
jgi:small subunit ribosomal protein S1